MEVSAAALAVAISCCNVAGAMTFFCDVVVGHVGSRHSAGAFARGLRRANVVLAEAEWRRDPMVC